MPEQKFEIQENPCYFCGHPKTILFREQFIFCPDCSAIYMSDEPPKVPCNCSENAPVIYRHPWFDRDTPKPFIYRATFHGLDTYRCSECGEVVTVDGE